MQRRRSEPQVEGGAAGRRRHPVEVALVRVRPEHALQLLQRRLHRGALSRARRPEQEQSQRRHGLRAVQVLQLKPHMLQDELDEQTLEVIVESLLGEVRPLVRHRGAGAFVEQAQHLRDVDLWPAVGPREVRGVDVRHPRLRSRASPHGLQVRPELAVELPRLPRFLPRAQRRRRLLRLVDRRLAVGLEDNPDALGCAALVCGRDVW